MTEEKQIMSVFNKPWLDYERCISHCNPGTFSPALQLCWPVIIYEHSSMRVTEYKIQIVLKHYYVWIFVNYCISYTCKSEYVFILCIVKQVQIIKNMIFLFLHLQEHVSMFEDVYHGRAVVVIFVCWLPWLQTSPAKSMVTLGTCHTTKQIRFFPLVFNNLRTQRNVSSHIQWWC